MLARHHQDHTTFLGQPGIPMKFRTGGLPRFCHDVNGWSWRVNNIQCSHSSFIVNNKWFLQTHDWVMTVDSTALSNLWTCLSPPSGRLEKSCKKTVKGGRVLGERCKFTGPSTCSWFVVVASSVTKILEVQSSYPQNPRNQWFRKLIG